MMDLDELQSVRDRERQTDKLQQLRESFYADTGEFIQQLRRERERAAERADDPFDAPDVNRLTDEINTAEGTVEAIFERRIGKIVKAASLAAADQPMDAEGMTAEETVLFEDLVDDIVTARHRVFDTLDGETSESAADTRADPSPVRSAGDGTPGHDTEPADGHRAREQETAVDEGSETVAPPAADGQSKAEPDREGGTEPRRERETEPRRERETDSHRGAMEPEPDPEADSVSAADLMGGDAGETATGRGTGTGTGGELESGAETGTRIETGTEPENEPNWGPGPDERRAVAGAPDASTTASSVEGDEPGDSDQPVREDGGIVARETVRITDDVGEIFGVDEREYDLVTDDVVQLPAENARPLIERGAAERLD